MGRGSFVGFTHNAEDCNVTQHQSQRGYGHCDWEQCAWLFYRRDIHRNLQGGDLKLHRWKVLCSVKQQRLFVNSPTWTAPARTLLSPNLHRGNISLAIAMPSSLLRMRPSNRASSTAASISRHDCLALPDVYVTAAARCAPPGNKPTSEDLRKFPPLPRTRGGPAEKRESGSSPGQDPCPAPRAVQAIILRDWASAFTHC